MESAGKACVCESGGGDVLVSAYRRTLKAKAEQHNQAGNGGEIHKIHSKNLPVFTACKQPSCIKTKKENVVYSTLASSFQLQPLKLLFFII